MKWRNAVGKREDEALLRKPWEERITPKFAWLPININGTSVWLEKYYIHEYWGVYSKEWINATPSLHDGTY